MTSPPLVPVPPPIDRNHLDRMTLQDRSLEREVLTLFDAQSLDLALRLRTMPADAGVLAHTLKGSARAIGAFPVADAVENLEAAMRTESGIREAVSALEDAIGEVRAAIDGILKQS